MSCSLFSGSGDSSGIGAGARLLFNLLSTDASKSITIEYDERVDIADIIILSRGAPFGSHIKIEILNASDTVIEIVAINVPLISERIFTLDCDGRTTVGDTDKLKITVYNSSGTGGEDAAAAFVCAFTVEMFRESEV